MGYSRTAKAMKERLESVMAALLPEGCLEDNDHHLVLAMPSEN